MRITSSRLGPSRFEAMKVIATIAGLGFPPVLRAAVREVEFKDLVTRSHLIVVATVSKIENGPANLERVDPGMPALKVATARVIETWKGAPVREVRYVASPSWVCDKSGAEKGERVVLFLERRKDAAFLTITHAGRGRMPLREVGAKIYAALQDEVILPKGTPTISEKKTARAAIPSTEPGKPAPELITFTYDVTAIEVGVLQGLVRPSGR
jgi:hypothetical protein